ncbi:MAG: hypothetical protein ABS35_37625 [Kaistia sp. SCN 65-12]|nr:MAG: hypothetical protein ABS35_37625 [Kaistia sp. SCN 65-12]
MDRYEDESSASMILRSDVGLPESRPNTRKTRPVIETGLILLAAVLAASPALADGGDGRGFATSIGGLGGTDGTLPQATGQDGQAYTGIGGGAGTGGGGGVDLTTGNGASGGSRGTYGPAIASGTKGATGVTGLTVGAPTGITTAVSGGDGGDGAAAVDGVSTDGGGGGGGAGVRATADVTVTGTGVVTGGAGGRNPNAGGGGGGVGVFSSADVAVEAGGQVTGGAGGGSADRNSPDRTGGGGGGGAAAIVLTDGGTVQNSGALTGGAGGGSVLAGGGDGGAAVQLLDGGTVINAGGGTIIGGAGGAGSVTTPSAGPATAPGSGGAGIKGASIAVINGGTIGGGAGGTGTGWTPIDGQAILFTGGVNSLEIWSTSNIIGNVAAFSAADTFKLGGATDGVFDLSEIGAGAKYDGFGLYEKVGTGVWSLTGAPVTAVPLWTIRDGTLRVDIVTDSDMDVVGGTLAGIGTVGDAANFSGGTIAPGNGGIGTLTVAGDYTSNGGALAIDAELGPDGSPADVLRIDGDSVLGTGATQVLVTNLGGAGAETTGDGIKIVDIGGTSASGAFELGGPAIGGAYTYNLFQNGVVDVSDGDWYLRAVGLAPTVPVYENYPIVLLGMTELPTLQQRVGDRYLTAAGAAEGDANLANLWTRIEGAHGHVEGASTTGTSYDSSRFLLQVGMDGLLAANGTGILVGGLNAQYGRVTADIASDIGSGNNSTESYGLGATLTWYGSDGTYVDGQASVSILSSELSVDGVGDLTHGNGGIGYAFSIEAGRTIGIGGNWSLTPQAQLTYASVDFDDFADPFGATVSLHSGDSLKGRIGVALSHDMVGADGAGSMYGVANLTYEFLDGTAVDVAGVEVAFEPDSFGAELGLGGSYSWDGGKFAVHGEALATTSFEGSYGVRGTVGFKSAF